MSINTNELAHMLEEKDFNFVAECSSVLQMIGVNSAILYLESIGITVKGIVLLQVSDTLSKENYMANSFLERDGLDYRYVYGQVEWGDNKEKIAVFLNALKMKTNTDPIYLVGANLIHSLYYTLSMMNNRRVVYVEIDDGLQNYLNRHKMMLLEDINNNKYNNWKAPYEYLRRVINDVSYELLLGIVKKKNAYKDFCLLERKAPSLKSCRDVVDMYHVALQGKSERINLESEMIYGNYILLLGDYMSGEEEILLKVMRMLPDTKVVVRPHPRDKNTERFEKLGCEIMRDNNHALELILAEMENRPQIILADQSTVLMTANVLFGIPTISYSFLRKNSFYNKRFNKMFQKAFRNHVMFPQNEEDFINMLNGSRGFSVFE